jgi:hypothetical protein
MPIYRGSTPITAIYKGSTPVTAVYRGSTLIWSINTLRDDFNRADTANLSTGGAWADHSPAGLTYTAGIVNNTCRVAIPDGLIDTTMQTARKRYALAVSPDDDGYVEARVASVGDGTDETGAVLLTQVFGRVSNTAFTNGVGFQLDQSVIRIVRRAASTDTVMVADCGSYVPGNIIRLTQVGNLHTLTCNGAFRNEWNDTGATGSRGATFRSLGIRVDGTKDFLGPRRFSAALDYVEYG